MENELISRLSTASVEEKREILTELSKDEFSDEAVTEIVKMIEDEDAGIRDAVSQALIENSNEKIPELVVPYISSPNIAVRNLAGEILLKKGKPAIPAMLKYLKKANDDDQKFIIDILGLIGSSEVEDDIIGVLKMTQNDNVILACIEALGNIRSQKAVDLIIEKYGENELFHPTIFDALGKIGSKKAIDFMAKEYETADDLTKYSMIESMGEVGNEEIFFALLGELKKLNPPLTWVVVEALAKLHAKFALDIPFDESMKNTLVEVINEADMQYKIAASKLLKDFSDKEIIKASLANFGENEEFDENVKNKFFENPLIFYRSFIKLASDFKREGALMELFKEVVAGEEGQSLGELTPVEFRQLCDIFTLKLESMDEEVRLSAMELLFFLCLDTALVFLDTMIKDDNAWNKMRLLEFLSQLDGEEVNEALLKLKEDDDEMVADKAAEIINEKGIEEK